MKYIYDPVFQVLKQYTDNDEVAMTMHVPVQDLDRVAFAVWVATMELGSCVDKQTHLM